MMKRIMPLLMVLLLAVTITVVPVSALNDRIPSGGPTLQITGTTAYCEAFYRSGSSNASVSVTLTLKQGKTTIDSWNASGNGSVTISETSSVQTGKTYDLVMNATVNGKSQPEVIVSAHS